MGSAFSFGENWRRFLRVVSEERIGAAENSLREWLGRDGWQRRSFLDAGCGSGLFSLAARRLGARVRSFDSDPLAVECARELRRRYCPDDPDWIVEPGSVLDEAYLASLGRFEIVYCWGVLHHTGAMWRAMASISSRVSPGGKLHLAIYNDQGWRSHVWCRVKRMYGSGACGKALVLSLFVPAFVLRDLADDVGHGRNPTARYREYRSIRGMSRWHDWVDWLGGYPFEVATPGRVSEFLTLRGFTMERLHAGGRGSGCNQFLFVKKPEEF